MHWLRRWSAPALFVILAFTVFAVYQPAPAEDAKPATEDKWLIDRSLTLTPQPEPRPALEYRLFPLASDLKDGQRRTDLHAS